MIMIAAVLCVMGGSLTLRVVTDDDQTVTQTRQDSGLDRETQGRISPHLYPRRPTDTIPYSVKNDFTGKLIAKQLTATR